MPCFLVITTTVDLPEIPPRYAASHVRLSGKNACVISDNSATSSKIADDFGLSVEAANGINGMVVRLDYYSGSEKKEVVDRFHRLMKEGSDER